MPLIGNDDEMVNQRVPGSNFNFSGVRIEDLGATEYTLVNISVDTTGSTSRFADELRACVITAVEACKKSPRADNLLLRVTLFSTCFNQGVKELHGFKPLQSINPSVDYPQFDPDGLTPLNDVAYSDIGAILKYGADLRDNDFLSNGIGFIITDGEDNASKHTARDVDKMIQDATQKELVESLTTVLIGINASNCKTSLERFRQEAGITQYIDAGEATKGKLAKLAAFVSQSVSSTSQALGTGGPSQNISAKI